MGSTVFLSYGCGDFEAARDELCKSAIAVGFDRASGCSEVDLDDSFRKVNAATLSEKRGAGYWLWKPQIILQHLRRLDKGDVLVYSDAGRSFYYQLTRFPKMLIASARENGYLAGVAIRQHGPLRTWAKRDAFVILGLDNEAAYLSPVIQATWSLWTPTDEAFSFLEDWKRACEDRRCLTDIPNTQGQENLDGFKGHRHDQSLASLVAIRHGSPFLDYESTQLFRILALRPQSGLTHYFLRRMDDAESMERGEMSFGVARSFLAARRALRSRG